MKAYVTIGISASGKSTLAKKLCEELGLVEINRDNIRFGKIDVGGDWSSYQMNRENENRVTNIFYDEIKESSDNKKDIIISDTNLNMKYLKQMIYKLDKLGYEICLIEMSISLADAINYDYKRERSVGHDVIEKQYSRFLDYKSNYRSKLVESFNLTIQEC